MQAELGRLLGWETMMSARLRDIIAGVVAGERASIHACSETADNCGVLLDRFDATTEARAFDYHFGATLRAPLGLTGYSSLESYDYMYRDCRVADVLMEGPLERERGMIKRFQPTHVVLTAQGYLHCYADPTHLLEKSPDLSLNLATCAVVPLDDPHMFVVVASDKKLGRSRYAFRGPNPAATGHWVSAISSVAARQSTPPTPVASNTMRDAPAVLEQELDDFSIASDDYEEPEPMYDDPPAASRSLDIDSNAPAAAAAAEAAAPLEEQSPEASVPEGLAPGQASQVAMPEPQVLTLNILEEDAAPLPTASMAMAAPLPTSGMSMAAALPTSGMAVAAPLPTASMAMAAPLPTASMAMAAPLPTASMAMAAPLPTTSTATTNPLLGAPGGSGPGGGPGDVDARLLHPMPPPLGSAFPPGPF
ncbi:hypothetical protein IWQ57_001595 [Coemansia nantahalensis]|uniref:Uncharacterized protein n=1 Tax=Coemansia nantahalensis TaxID=2789366 RepID=A0ACC1K3X6_9FUNG|nr:hypothetical protein IWQ57_001595 [Coemansia nantahalensis]